MADTVVKVENVGKKFCRSLKRSLWYGIRDLGAELVGRANSHRDLRKGEFWAVQDVDLDLKRGETLGLIGPNGAGKTTLLRMLNGLIKPDQGQIEIRGRMQALIALGAGFNPILTGRENIYVNAAVLGISRAEVQRRFDEIVSFSGLEQFIDTPLQSYSSGMAVRLGFAVAAHLDPDILLVDEVLAVGDYGFQSKCLNKIGDLKRKGAAVVLVTHNMHTISIFTSRVILLEHGKHTCFDSVPEGIKKYRNAFSDSVDMSIEKVRTGGRNIDFYDVRINKRRLFPGDSFSIELFYDSHQDYNNIEIGIAVYSSNEQNLHFESTNRTFNKKLDLHKGRHSLGVTLHSMMINGASATIVLSIWSNRREEQVFWWRIPVEFESVPFSTGNNFVSVSFLENDAP